MSLHPRVAAVTDRVRRRSRGVRRARMGGAYARRPAAAALGTGRELFASMRHGASSAEQGGSTMLAQMAGVAAVGEEDGGNPETIEDRETDARM